MRTAQISLPALVLGTQRNVEGWVEGNSLQVTGSPMRTLDAICNARKGGLPGVHCCGQARTIAAMRAELAKVGATRPLQEPQESHRSNATP